MTCPVCKGGLGGLTEDAFKLHFFLHCVEGKAWCCNGVVDDEAQRYGVDPEMPVYNFLGRDRTCQRLLSASTFRSYWVYANIDADLLHRHTAVGAVDYVGMSTAALQARLLKNYRIFNAWRLESVHPRWVRTFPFRRDVRRMLVIPGTGSVIVVEASESLWLQSWRRQASASVPLQQKCHFEIFDVKLFWMESISSQVLLVALTDRTRSEVQLFTVDGVKLDCVCLASVMFSHLTSAFYLADSHLAVVAHTGPTSYSIESLRVMYDPSSTCVTITTIAVVRLGCTWTLAGSSCCILDDIHFLLANSVGVAVYRLPQRTLNHRGPAPRRINPHWSHRFRQFDVLDRPCLRLLVDSTSGDRTVAICGGNFLRRVVIAGRGFPKFRFSEVGLVGGVPTYLGIATGFYTGVYHQAFRSPAFVTFPLFDAGTAAHWHPFSPTVDPRDFGSIIYDFGQAVLEAGSINVDEVEGTLIFITRTGDVAELVVLNLTCDFARNRWFSKLQQEEAIAPLALRIPLRTMLDTHGSLNLPLYHEIFHVEGQ
ncbi:hypothetical protein C8R46DRAFT_1024906 [Mycena filopes]|nr:hypothetical protein C8R46DRAFT_1024906 [Mycena filopes]